MTLTAISIDRYYIIYKPMKARSICTNRKVKIIVTATWVLSSFIMSPLLYVFNYEEHFLPNHQNISNLSESSYKSKLVLCVEKWPYYELKLTYDAFLSFILFLFPVAFMSYAYFTISQTLWFVEKKDKMNENIIESIKSRNPRLKRSKKPKSRYSLNDEIKNDNTIEANLNHNINNVNIRNENNHLHKNFKEVKLKRLNEKAGKFRYKFNFKKRIISEKTDLNNKENDTINNEENIIENCYNVLDNDLNKELAYSLLDASSDDNCESNDFKSYVRRSIFKNSFLNRNFKRKSTKSRNITKEYTNAPAINSLMFQLKIYNQPCTINNLPNKSMIVHHQNVLAINKLIKSRRRVVKLLIILVVFFIISWLPYHITSLWIDLIDINNVKQKSLSLGENEVHNKDESSNMLSDKMFPISLWLALANSATNPVCYMALSHGFRTMLKTSFKRCFRCS